MIKLNLTGYVNKIRQSEVGGKKVVNINLNVPVGKDGDKKTYQSFDIAFWEKNAENVKGVQEKDYIFIPDVILSKFEINDKWINIRGMGNIIFKSLERNVEETKTDNIEKEIYTDELPF